MDCHTQALNQVGDFDPARYMLVGFCVAYGRIADLKDLSPDLAVPEIQVLVVRTQLRGLRFADPHALRFDQERAEASPSSLLPESR